MRHGQLNILSENFNPPKLMFRDTQLSELSNYTSFGQCVWAEGDSGLGKTLTVHVHADEEVYRGKGKVKSLYLKCQPSMKDTALACLRANGIRIPRLEINGQRFGEEILNKFPEVEQFIITIDEPENVRIWQQQVADFAHGLYDKLSEKNLLFSFIFTSQLSLVTQVERSFDKPAISRLKLKSIQFGYYNVDQITEIMKQRLDFIVDSEAIDVEALRTLAEHIYRVSGNIREALDILEHAVLTADTTLDQKVMSNAIHWGKSKWWNQKLRSGVGSPHNGLLLYVAARYSQDAKTLTIPCPLLMRIYREKASELNISPLSVPTLYENIRKNLISQGLFSNTYETEKTFQNKLIFNEATDRDWIALVGKEINWQEHIQGHTQPRRYLQPPVSQLQLITTPTA